VRDGGFELIRGERHGWHDHHRTASQFGVCHGYLQLVGENLRDFVNLLMQTVAMQIRDMARDQSGGLSRECVRQDLPCKFVDREWWKEPDWAF
jgi:hypothetical protein